MKKDLEPRAEPASPRGAMTFWAALAREGPGSVRVDGRELHAGSRVRLRPRAGGDLMDLALDGRAATVEAIDEDDTGRIHIAVTIDDDPGADLGEARHPGHRFFFGPDEVEPLPSARRVLVAGIGNVFLGDDGFGVAVAQRLAGRALPVGVRVHDFGIRGMDLAYALRDCDVALLVDAAPRGLEPGTLSIIDAGPDADDLPGIDTHGMDPARVLALACALGPLPDRILVLACEPAIVPDPDTDEIVSELSAPVAAAVDVAVAQIEALLPQLQQED